MNKVLRVYFDYNIYTQLAHGKISLPNDYSQFSKVYVSVAHAEEFYNAVKCDQENKNKVHLEEIKLLFTRKMNNYGVLNPSYDKIHNVNEKFADAVNRVRVYDTRKKIEEDAYCLHEYHKNEYRKVRHEYTDAVNNSNLSYEEIWSRPEVIEALALFDKELERNNSEIVPKLSEVYGYDIAVRMKKIYQLPSFSLKKNVFKYDRAGFVKLEFTIEFLQNVLQKCGFHRDKNIRTVKSGIYDTEHSIYATYCNYFITNDKSLSERLNAIYFFLGLKTRCLSFDDWCELNNNYR